MKRQLTLLTAAILVSGNLMAAEPSSSEDKKSQQKTNEMIGLGSGVVVGSIVAGPLGGAIAGIFGLLIADDVNDEAKLADANQALSRKQGELVAMQSKMAGVERDSANQQRRYEAHLANLTMQQKAQIQFRTGSHEIEDHYYPQLNLLAKHLRDNPKLKVQLSGYADNRGDDTYNQALSEQRAISVKNYLLGKGVKTEQLLTESYGESAPVTAGQTYEDNFFERRVTIKVDESEVMTAAVE